MSNITNTLKILPINIEVVTMYRCIEHILFFLCAEISAVDGSLLCGGVLDHSTPNKESHDKRFQCHTCGKRYASRFGLRAHEGLQHNNSKYRCNVCNQGFMAKAAHAGHEVSYISHSNVSI